MNNLTILLVVNTCKVSWYLEGLASSEFYLVLYGCMLIRQRTSIKGAIEPIVFVALRI